MRVTVQQLGIELKQNLLPVYLLFGTDPYRKTEALKCIRAQAKTIGITERERFEISSGFNWEHWYANTQMPSLFSEKRLWECHLDETLHIHKTLGTLGAKILLQYLKTPPADIILLIIAPKLETTALASEWFKAIEAKGMTVYTCLPRTKMPPKVFDLMDAISLGSIPKTKRVFFSLKKEVDAILVLWALLKKIRSLNNSHNHPIYLFEKAKNIDEMIKGYKIGDVWHELYLLSLYLMGVKILDE